MPKLSSTYTFESTESDYNASEIDNLKILIHAYDLAIQNLISNRHASYEIDTGQTKQRVTRLDLKNLIETRKILIEELESRLSIAGLNRNGVVIVPCF